jgi:hypothetical protein
MWKLVPLLIVVIFILNGFGFIVISEEGKKTFVEPSKTEEFDMVIISPNKFSIVIQPLIDHKFQGFQVVCSQ